MQSELRTIDFANQAEVRVECGTPTHGGNDRLAEDILRSLDGQISPPGANHFRRRRERISRLAPYAAAAAKINTAEPGFHPDWRPRLSNP